MKKIKLAVLSLLAVSAIGLASCSGEQGPRGLEGPKGEKGDKGDQGPKGETGNEGPAGPVGPKGDQGPKGEKGDKGDRGETGATGEKGEKGDTGATGEKGEKGDKGDKGDTGASGKTAWSNTILPSEGGYVVPSVGSAVVGSEITFTVKHNAGYVFNSLLLDNTTISRKEFKVVSDTTYSYTTIMKENGYVVQANFSDGTKEENPIIITSVEEMKSVFEGYTNNKYYLLDKSIGSIDCTKEKVYNLRFYGHLDANGVEFKNLPNTLFYMLGYGKESTPVTIKNLSAELTRGSLVFYAYSPNITFENVSISGTVEGNGNVGGFINYGYKFDMNLTFKNCKSTATLINKASNNVGVLIGYAYNANSNFNIYVDDDTIKGIQGTKAVLLKSEEGKSNGNLFYGWKGAGNVLVYNTSKNNEKIENTTLPAENVYHSLVKVNPTKENNTFKIAKAENAVKYAAYFWSNTSEFDTQGQKLPNEQGITNAYPFIDGKEKEFGDATDAVVWDKALTKFVFQGGEEYLRYEYDEKVETLKLYKKVVDGHLYTGSIWLIVTQYDKDNIPVSIGSIQLLDFSKDNKVCENGVVALN